MDGYLRVGADNRGLAIPAPPMYARLADEGVGPEIDMDAENTR